MALVSCWTDIWGFQSQFGWVYTTKLHGWVKKKIVAWVKLKPKL